MSADVCIIGGGLVGLTAAIALSFQGRKVKLLEASSQNLERPTELDVRSIALSYSTIQIFKALGIWDSLQRDASPISTIHVSSAGHFGVTRLHAGDLQLEAMGYVIEYHLLIQHLLEIVEKDPNIELLCPAVFQSLEQNLSAVKIKYQQDGFDKTIDPKLLIIADGANSAVREKLGIASEKMDYQQSAVIANVKIEQDMPAVAYERFTSDGPIALLPLPSRRYALVWTNKPQRALELMDMSDEDFTRQLYLSFGYRLGYFSQIGRRDQFKLTMSRSSQLTSGRCVLIGNAANSLHPVAGQGFNLALRDIGFLYDQLLNHSLESEQVLSRLEDYQVKRATDQQQTVRMGNGLVELFSNKLPVLNHLRAGALTALELCPALKREVSWRGMGYGPGVCSLMRGAK